MKTTFVCNESMIITIPFRSLREAGEGHLMPCKFHCVFQDSYKIFVVRGKPKVLGAAQVIAAVFICTLCLFLKAQSLYIISSILFVISGLVTYAAGQIPNVCVAKLSLTLNAVNFILSVVALVFSGVSLQNHSNLPEENTVNQGIIGLIMSLLVIENALSLFLVYWLTQAVCRKHFNTLPTVLLKQAD